MLSSWWTYTFLAYETLVLVPPILINVFNPFPSWKDFLPNGWDKSTDELKRSKRVQVSGAMNATLFATILGLLWGTILFAKHDLAPYPDLQRTLMRRVVGVTAAADPFLYAVMFYRLPRALLLDSSKWSKSIKAMVFVSPIGLAWKCLYLFSSM